MQTISFYKKTCRYQCNYSTRHTCQEYFYNTYFINPLSSFYKMEYHDRIRHLRFLAKQIRINASCQPSSFQDCFTHTHTHTHTEPYKSCKAVVDIYTVTVWCTCKYQVLSQVVITDDYIQTLIKWHFIQCTHKHTHTHTHTHRQTNAKR